MPPETAREKRYLVTSALPYANGDIHLGHLLEVVQTDIFVRYHKLCGHDVVYVCADDTHGTPIELSALKQGITPEALIDKARQNHIRDYSAFAIDFDIFYTTNSEENRKYAELVFERLKSSDLVVQKEISQYYCENDKRFLPDRFITGICPKCKKPDQYGDVCEACGATYEPSDLLEPRCFICGEKPVLRKSTHFYVQLAKCEEFLRNYVSSAGVLQDDMRNFVTSWINDGLREWCISRDGPYFGFEIPGTKNKFFYVWLDAPIGYISSTDKWCHDKGKDISDYWGSDSTTEIVHFIGKDIVYFHALFWPVMLRSAGYKLPARIFVHGFLNIQGQKMSKSRGTFILAKDYVSKVHHAQAPEFLRFYFGSKLAPNSGDIDLNRDELLSRVNTSLVNNIGNLHHRTFVFCKRYFNEAIPEGEWDDSMAKIVEEAAGEIAAYYDAGEFKSVVERVHALGSIGNKYYQDNKPWELIKTNPSQAACIMVTCANLIKSIGVFLKPIIPEIAGHLEKQFGTVFGWDDYRFSISGQPLGETQKLVQPLEKEALDPLFTIHEEVREPSTLIDIEAFKKVDLRIGIVKEAGRIPESTKLLKLKVALGSECRQVIAGIASSYAPEDLVGRSVVIVANLKPAVLFGQKSEGMLLAAQDANGGMVLLQPEKGVSSGAQVA